MAALLLEDGTIGYLLEDGTSHLETESDYAQAVLNLVPVGYYRLGETTGTLARAQAWKDLTHRNTPTLGVAGLLDGDPDKAISLARASVEGAEAADAENPAGSATGASVVAWVQFGSFLATERHTILAWNGDTAGEGYHLFYFDATSGTAGTLIWKYTDGTVRFVTDSSWTPGSVRHMVSVRHDYAAETVIFGIDGVERTVDVSANGVPLTIPLNGPTLGHVAVGLYSPTLHGLNGTLDEVAFFKTVLTAADIAALYALGITRPPYRNPIPSLIAQ